jgi:cell division septum initiation protein DivIVA
MPDTEAVMETLMAALYTTLTDANDEVVPANERERFISWCLPGIPVDADELRFAEQGLVGLGADAAAQGKDTALLLGQASRFARLVDFTPDAKGVFGEQQQMASFQSDAGSLSRTYERALKQSQVAKAELTEEQRGQLERFRNLLYPEQEITDLVTGKTETKRVEGPILRAYKEFQAKYEDALFAYNEARVKAMSAANPEAVLNFSMNGDALRRRVRTAEGDWAAAGHRRDVEGMLAVIESIGLRDLSVWKADLLDRFDKGRLSDTLGQEFWWTSLVPGGFAASDSGWSTFTFNEQDMKTFASAKSTKWEVDGKIGWGALSVGGEGSGTTASKKEVKDVTNLKMSFGVAQIPLEYSWLDEYFLRSRAWRIAPDAVEGEQLSDGGSPPTGAMVAYATSVIFVRDVTIDASELHDESSELSKTFKAKGGGGWGPFKVGGGYSRESQEKTVETTLDEKGLTIKGLQIIGFRCRLLDKAPNPLENVEWVG